MPLNPELKERLADPSRADAAMMEVASHYIHQPRIEIDEVAHAIGFPPFVNEAPPKLDCGGDESD